jgi:hypothetical protein
MNHNFNTEIAELYGVDEAIVIENLYFWIKKNEVNKKHFEDGKYWTYNSAVGFSEWYPYWSSRQIERILTSLKTKKCIITGNYNTSNYDRTRWFALTESVSSIYANTKIETHEDVNGFTKTREPIPDNKPDTKPDKKEYKEKAIKVFSENEDLDKTYYAYINMRTKIKKPITDYAIKLLMIKLNKLTSNEKEQIQILNQSIFNSWQGVFPIKENFKACGATNLKDLDEGDK